MENQSHQAVLEHDFSDRWSSRLGVSYKQGSLRGFSTEAQATLQADETTLRRQRRFRDYNSSDLSVQGEVLGRLQTGELEHELLVGVETYRFKLEQLMLRVNPTAAAPYSIDVFSPSYGQTQPTPLPNTDTREAQSNVATYVQDTIKLGPQWRVLLGVRHDRYDQELLNRRTSVATHQSPSATSPRVGLSYLPSQNVTLFANLGRSFRPNVGVSAGGSGFDPESGRAYEVGSKWESNDKTIGSTVALYDIRKSNVLTTDPGNAGFSIAAGEVRSRGMDLDVVGQVTRNWRLNASLTLNDASVTKDNTLEVGGRLLNIPRVNGSVLLVYEDGIGDAGRYGVGGGITHTGRRLGEARTQAQANAGTAAFELPEYTIAKIVAYWKINRTLRLSLDINNVFDKTYYTNSFQRTWVALGQPRTITVGAQLKF